MFFFFIIIPPFPVVVVSATSTAGCGYNVRLHNQFYNRFSDIWGRGKSGSSRNSVGTAIFYRITPLLPCVALAI